MYKQLNILVHEYSKRKPAKIVCLLLIIIIIIIIYIFLYFEFHITLVFVLGLKECFLLFYSFFFLQCTKNIQCI